MVADATDVPAISDVHGYGLYSDRRADARAAFSTLASDDRAPFSSPYLAVVAEIEDHAQRGSEELPKLLGGYKTDASYPATPIGRSLALAAQIVAGRLGTRVIYVQHGSFDTHISQKATQDRLLEQFSDAIERVLRRPRRARQRRPRPDDDVLRVRAARRRERQQRHRSRRGQPDAADRRRRQGRHLRRPPLARRNSTPATRSTRPIFAACTRPCSNAGSDGRPTRSSPVRSRRWPRSDRSGAGS